MPSKIYNNVVDHRLLDGGRVVEDVTSVTLPTIEHPTTTIASAGMVMDVDVPNMAHINAMEIAISHNNGVNCHLLATPGKHSIEFRLARQRYNVANGEIGFESAKYRVTCMHKSTEDGTVETNNPMGSTEKLSILRYEKEINGKVVTLIDAMAGIIKVNGKDCTNAVENLLK